jgi:hypothetical protein
MSSLTITDKSQWKWTMMIMQPEVAGVVVFQAAMRDGQRKTSLTSREALKLGEFVEGSCAQILHFGPFSEEGPTICRRHDFSAERAALTGKYRGAHLRNIRKTSP